MAPEPIRYRSDDEDSGRWAGFAFRDGDIVISTRSKSGTTWMQMICALLVFQRSELPAPLAELSPWLDWLAEPREDVLARLAGQRHRRFIKTHTPLDGISLDARATYIVVARHPLDLAVSLYHQGDNIDRRRLAQLTGSAASTRPRRRLEVREWLVDWIESDPDPRDELDSLPGVMHHLRDAWARRHEPNVVLVRYADLGDDLGAEMGRLADHLAIEVPDGVWPELVDAASFDSMRADAERVAPDPSGVLKDRSAFFRRGRPGAGAEVLGPDGVARYVERAESLAPADLLAWLHR